MTREVPLQQELGWQWQWFNAAPPPLFPGCACLPLAPPVSVQVVSDYYTPYDGEQRYMQVGRAPPPPPFVGLGGWVGVRVCLRACTCLPVLMHVGLDDGRCGVWGSGWDVVGVGGKEGGASSTRRALPMCEHVCLCVGWGAGSLHNSCCAAAGHAASAIHGAPLRPCIHVLALAHPPTPTPPRGGSFCCCSSLPPSPSPPLPALVRVLCMSPQAMNQPYAQYTYKLSFMPATAPGTPAR